jgi:hypothetical protein
MEMTEYTRTQFLRYRKSYLAELEKFVGRVVRTDELMSASEAGALLGNAKFRRCPKVFRKFHEGFVGSTSFFKLLKILEELNPSPVSIWVLHTQGMGALVVPSLKEIDHKFAFVTDGEVASFITTDGNDIIVIENEIDDHTETIELQGLNWSGAFDIFQSQMLIVEETQTETKTEH